MLGILHQFTPEPAGLGPAPAQPAGHLEIPGLHDDRAGVFGLEPVLQHLELQPAHRAQDRQGGAALGPEHLDHALLGDLLHALEEALAPARVGQAHRGELLRGKARHGVEFHGSGGREDIADAEQARIDQAQDVARVGLVHDQALPPEEHVRVVQLDLLASAHVQGVHAALEVAGDDAGEGHPVPVGLVHVGLDLEDEGGERGVHLDGAASGQGPGVGRRSHVEELVQELRDAEVVDGAAEEHGRLAPGQERLAVEGRQHVVHEVDVVAQLLEFLGGQQGPHFRVLQGALPRHPGLAPGLGALEHLDLPGGAHVDALEIGAGADGPGHGHGVQAEQLLHLVDQFHRLPARAVQLVDEGEDRQAALAGHAEQLLGLLLHALGAVQQHHHAVGGGERPVGVLAEVLVAGGVQQVDDVVLVLELHGRRGDRDAPLLLDGHPVRLGVARALPALDRAGPVDGAAVEQQLLGEGGLARVGVADDGEGAPALDLFK